jgi:hypothetical protein
MNVPSHIAILLEPTPSAIAKLVAAWDGLSTEIQILLLAELEKMPLPCELRARVFEKAFDRSNAYVRYLAAKGLYSSCRDEQREAVGRRIGQDTEPLVRYCLLETAGSAFLLNDPESFWALPHAARLARVRCLKESGEEVAKLISHALANLKETVGEMELG